MTLLEAYEMVTNDIANDIGWEDGVQEQIVEVLEFRAHELKTVWSEV